MVFKILSERQETNEVSPTKLLQLMPGESQSKEQGEGARSFLS